MIVHKNWSNVENAVGDTVIKVNVLDSGFNVVTVKWSKVLYFVSKNKGKMQNMQLIFYEYQYNFENWFIVVVLGFSNIPKSIKSNWVRRWWKWSLL